MVQQVIDVGTSASDGTGDPLRDAFTKINDNFNELYATVDNEGLTYGNIVSNVAGITFNVTRFTENYSATPVLQGSGQTVGTVYLIQGNVLGGSTPLNDVLLTVTSLANVIVGNVATVSASGVPIAPVLRVNGLTGNVVLTINNIAGAASKAYVNSAISSNIANVTGTITDSLSANITAANLVISNHSARITTLESNAATQATAIAGLSSTRATVSYVDTSIALALSSNAILANVASVNANVAAANAAIQLRANLSGAVFTGNISANSVHSNTTVRADTYFIGGSETNQGLGQNFANPAAMFFGNSAISPGPGGSRYYQINLQNLDPVGSGDIVVTADDGSDQSNYIALGVNGSQYNDPAFPYGQPHDGYVWLEGGTLALVSTTDEVVLMASNVGLGQVIISKSNIMDLINNTVIRFSDGTIQSTAFGGNADLSSVNANITAANIAITNLQSNAGSQALDINSLQANAGSQAVILNSLSVNAGVQATSINSLNANVGSYQTFANANIAGLKTNINSINANLIAANINIATLLSNASAQSLALDNLQSNSQSQESSIIALTSNSATQAVQINLLNSNVSAANINISSLLANSATQGSQIDLLNGNINASNIRISNLESNASVQSLQLDNLQTNLNFVYSNLTSINANVNAANARIVNIDANLGSASTNITTLQNNVTTLFSNAASQATSITTLTANAAVQDLSINSLISNASIQGAQITAIAANINSVSNIKANLTGAMFSGNIQAPYILSNANVIATNGIFESVQTVNSINYPNLGSRFIGNVDSYYQVVIQNLSSSSDASGELVITADSGNNDVHFMTVGINSSTFNNQWNNTIFYESPLDGFVECVGGNLSIRTLSNVFLTAGNSLVALAQHVNNIILFNCNLQFYDGTVQTTAIADVPGLYSNIGLIRINLNDLHANVGAYENYANANIGTISTSLGTLDSNIGSYQIYANANAASQSVSIDNINANIGSYQIYANANAASQSVSIDNINANIGSYQIYANANIGSYQLYANGNSSTQAVSINNINANIGSFQTYANLELLAKANISGQIFNGNVQADYLIANSNVKIGSTLEVGLPASINLGNLVSNFVANANAFYSLNLQNLSNQNRAAGQFRVTADDGTLIDKYVALGITSSNYSGNFTVPAGSTNIQSYPYDGFFTTIGGNASVSSDGSVYLLANTSVVGLYKDSNFTLGSNVSLEFNDGSILANANIGAQSYTPNNAANYNATISNIQQALDELAARLRALGG